MPTAIDFKCVELCGITIDYFNEYPSDSNTSLEDWIKLRFEVLEGFRSYTERYQGTGILAKSDSVQVLELDSIAEKVREAVKLGDIDRVRELVKKALLFKDTISNFKPDDKVW